MERWRETKSISYRCRYNLLAMGRLRPKGHGLNNRKEGSQPIEVDKVRFILVVRSIVCSVYTDRPSVLIPPSNQHYGKGTQGMLQCKCRLKNRGNIFVIRVDHGVYKNEGCLSFLW